MNKSETMNVTIPAHIVRAAQACAANNAVRYYLNGICLTPNGEIVGCDGHTLFRSYAEGIRDLKLAENLILSIDGTVPKGASVCTFEIKLFDGKPETYGTILKCSNPERKTFGTKIFMCEVIDGRYPNYQRVIPNATQTYKGSANHWSSGTFNASYLALVSLLQIKPKGEDFHGVTINLLDGNSAMSMTPNGDGWPVGTVLVVMPMQADNVRDINGGPIPPMPEIEATKSESESESDKEPTAA